MNEHPLRCSVFVAILLRLFAIYWAVMGVFAIPGSLQMFSHAYPAGSSWMLWVSRLSYLVVPVIYGFFAMMAWIFGGRIGVKVAGAGDPPIPVRNVSRDDLLAFGILVTGLYYFLGNIGQTINWLHYLAISKDLREIDPQVSENPLYRLTTSLIPCLAGLLLAIASPTLGRKLARRPALPGD